MPSFRSAQTHAEKAITALVALGTAKHTAEDKTGIHSVGTAKTYQSRLVLIGEWLDANGHKDGLHRITCELANAYLMERSEEVSQSTLDGDRQALQAVLKEKLPVTRSALGRGSLSSRSRHYTDRQVELISAAQSARNRLATQVSQAAGLRAHELLTLRRIEERGHSTHRVWSNDRFLGRETWVRYTVEGKGGLIREVALPPELAKALEAYRLETPLSVIDRGIAYQTHYTIGGGQAWSQSFSSTSKSQLGWSSGAHALRHRYAQDRMGELQSRGLFYREALEIVSQERGHFRADITEVYLR